MSQVKEDEQTVLWPELDPPVPLPSPVLTAIMAYFGALNDSLGIIIARACNFPQASVGLQNAYAIVLLGLLLLVLHC
jgi:hypothetical protein